MHSSNQPVTVPHHDEVGDRRNKSMRVCMVQQCSTCVQARAYRARRLQNARSAGGCVLAQQAKRARQPKARCFSCMCMAMPMPV